VCVCVRERQTDRKTETEREREKGCVFSLCVKNTNIQTDTEIRGREA